MTIGLGLGLGLDFLGSDEAEVEKDFPKEFNGVGGGRSGRLGGRRAGGEAKRGWGKRDSRGGEGGRVV